MKAEPGQAAQAPQDPPEAEVETLRRGYHTLERILDLLGHVTEKETVDDVCRTIVEGVREQLGFDRAGLHLWHEDEGQFRGTFGTDAEGKTCDEHDLWWPGESWAPWKKICDGEVFIEDELDQPPPAPGEEGIKAYLVVLRFGARLYGILSVDNRISRRPVAEDELRFLPLFSRIVGNAVDLSRAREQIAESVERFRQVAENSREWIWEMDAEGRYTYSSPIVKDVLGLTAAEIEGQLYTKSAVPEHREPLRTAFENAAAKKAQVPRMITRHAHRDGAVVALETTALPMIDDEGNLSGYRGAHRDVTLQIEMEEQLRQAQKMEAVGRLAGGIAHYFNNLLTMIIGCSSMLMEQLGGAADAKDDIEQIRKAGEQATALTRQLLALSKRQVLNIRALDLNTMLRDVEKLLGHTLGRGIELVMRLDPSAPAIKADEDRIKYVILHLVINARAAMTEKAEEMKLSPIGGGNMQWSVTPPGEKRELIIGTSPVMLPAQECDNRPQLQPGNYLMLTICDTGVGMPEEVRQHIFEPFFSTKEVGTGTGLSLSSIYATVSQMHGDIQVESELGKGTTFRLYLPAADE